MLYLIPPTINPDSNAESKFFNIFKDIEFSNDTYLFHSVNLPEHKYKEWGEIDFLLVSKRGILIFEIKGGRVSRENGVWYYTDRYNNRHRKSEGPNDQAKSAMYSLKETLQKKLPKINFKNITFGWAVVFPDKEYAAYSLELPEEFVFDKNKLSKNILNMFISELYDSWDSRNKNLLELKNFELDSIVKFIRPSLYLVPSFKSKIDDVYSEQMSLTESQYKFLEMSESNDRILCCGGAGTGKTLAAIEIAKRESLNKNVLFICMSEILSNFINLQLKDFDITTCSYKKISSLNEDKYDLLIVDEGQDLLKFEILSTLDSILIGGFEKGVWRWFMDNNNQSNIENIIEEDSLELLNSYKDCILNFTRNCRNTEEIVLQTQLNTGADIGESEVKGKGISVTYQDINNENDAVQKIVKYLHKMTLELEILNYIVILSPFTFENSIVRNLPEKWKSKIQILDSNNVTTSNPEKILFSTIKNYKGLENKVVILVDLNNLEDFEQSISNIYVGMTRSNFCLLIQRDEKLQEFFCKQNEKYHLKIKQLGV